MTSIRQPVSRAWGMGVGAWDNIAFTITWAREHTALLILGFAGFLGFLWIGTSPYVCGLLITGLYALGGWLWWTEYRHTDTPRQHLARVLLPPTLLATFALAGMWLALVSLMALVALVAVLYAQEPETEDGGWWSEETLREALFGQHGVIGRRDGAVLSRHGQPEHTENGTTVRLALPGVPAADVAKKRDALAAQLGIPARLLTVDHDPDEPANVVRLRVSTAATKSGGATRSPLGDLSRTVWHEPYRIGVDDEGRPVMQEVAEQNRIVGGVPGSGKTSDVRKGLVPFLLDADAAVYLLDGKGSRRDFGAVIPLCAQYVSGTAEDAVDQLEAMLGRVLTIVRERNSSTEPEPGALCGGWPGVKVLLEELQDVRSAADQKQRDRIDTLLSRIVRMGRAVGVCMEISTQRPAVEDVPSGVRNLLTQRLCLMVRNNQDAAIILGEAPGLPLPRQRGQAILTTPAETKAVTLDLLDDEQWRQVCARAAALRAPRESQTVSLVKEPERIVPTLYDEAFRLLQGGEMRARELYEALPVEVRPKDSAEMGRRLSKAAEFASRRDGRGTLWSIRAPSVTDSARSDRAQGLALSPLSGASV